MIHLQPPSMALASSYLEFVNEMAAIGEQIWERNTCLANESPEQFVARLLRAKNQPEVGLVPETTYWAIENSKVIGRIALRYFLNENLKEFGGHIGYEVRPSARRKGFATEMLRLVLETPKAKEIGEILVTCSPDNIGSNRAILANGGILERTVFVEKWQRLTNYYWITNFGK